MVGETIECSWSTTTRSNRSRLVKALRLQPGSRGHWRSRERREGVQLARTLRPDVMLMDFRMAGLDGFSAAGAIMRDVPARRSSS